MDRTNEFDFDGWSSLAQRDPAAFERRRRIEIARLMRRVPVSRRRRLRCLQWRVDQVRRRAGTPLAACIRISQMMWESVSGKHGLIAVLGDTSPRTKAAVLPFRGDPKSH